jgi:hypothetical protein
MRASRRTSSPSASDGLGLQRCRYTLLCRRVDRHLPVRGRRGDQEAQCGSESSIVPRAGKMAHGDRPGKGKDSRLSPYIPRDRARSAEAGDSTASCPGAAVSAQSRCFYAVALVPKRTLAMQKVVGSNPISRFPIPSRFWRIRPDTTPPGFRHWMGASAFLGPSISLDGCREAPILQMWTQPYPASALRAVWSWCCSPSSSWRPAPCSSACLAEHGDLRYRMLTCLAHVGHTRERRGCRMPWWSGRSTVSRAARGGLSARRSA